MRYSRVIVFFNIPYIGNKALYPLFLIISKSRVVTSMNSFFYAFVYFFNWMKITMLCCFLLYNNADAIQQCKCVIIITHISAPS